jgi:hypothetical protein
MRNISTVINQILLILAGATIQPADQDNITTLQAELRIILRRAAYNPPEAGNVLWLSLATTLYRYLPPASGGGYPAQISAIVTQ